MKLEALLPIGKLDPGLREPERALELSAVGSDARTAETLGYNGVVVEETKDDPFQVMALAAANTTTIGVGTSVAIAFPRSPTVTAMSAWTLQKLSRGRFTLGLGSQVRGHIRRRYGMEWSAPGPWMRDYVLALRAIWQAWQNGEPLDFRSEHYTLNLVVPLFNPGPIDHPEIPIHLAAVNPYMCRVAGEVADGLRPHPVCTPVYMNEVMLPALTEGLERSGRTRGDMAIAIKPLVATGPDDASVAERAEIARARVAFYFSTPAYRPVFALHGWGELADRMNGLSRAQRWEDMPRLVTDEMLETMAVIGSYAEIANRLDARYGSIVTAAEFGIPLLEPTDRDALARIIDDVAQLDTQTR